MSARDLARFTALARVAIGGAFLAYPPWFMRPWIGADARRPGAVLLARAVGARDLVLAAGTLANLSAGASNLRPWLCGALAADATDLALTLADSGSAVPAAGRVLVSAVAAGGVGLGAASLALLRD